MATYPSLLRKRRPIGNKEQRSSSLKTVISTQKFFLSSIIARKINTISSLADEDDTIFHETLLQKSVKDDPTPNVDYTRSCIYDLDSNALLAPFTMNEFKISHYQI